MQLTLYTISLKPVSWQDCILVSNNAWMINLAIGVPHSHTSCTITVLRTWRWIAGEDLRFIIALCDIMRWHLGSKFDFKAMHTYIEIPYLLWMTWWIEWACFEPTCPEAHFMLGPSRSHLTVCILTFSIVEDHYCREVDHIARRLISASTWNEPINLFHPSFLGGSCLLLLHLKVFWLKSKFNAPSWEKVMLTEASTDTIPTQITLIIVEL